MVVKQCGYSTLSEIYSKDGIEKLKIPFGRPVQFTTKKGICQGYIEFVEYLEFFDDLAVPEKRRILLITFLKKAYKSFCRGVSVDVANRRVKISEAIRNDELPTYAEVCKVYETLLSKVNLKFVCYLLLISILQ